MSSDFSFSYITPFYRGNLSQCWNTIFEKLEKEIELKINNVEEYNVLNPFVRKGKVIESKVIYLVDSKLNAYTLLNTTYRGSTYRAISYSTFYATKYIVSATLPEKEITHFTKETKIKKMYYYQSDLNYIFDNSSVSVERKIMPKSKYINIKGRREKEFLLGNIIIDNNEVKIFLINSFNATSFSRNINIIPTNYLRLEFKHYVNFDFAYKIKRKIDAVLYLLIFTDNVSNKLEFIDTKKNRYTYFDLENKYNEKALTLPSFNTKNTQEIFINLLNLFMNKSNDENNAFLPFLDFYKNKPSVEIEFLEYYRMLELIEKTKNQKLNKGKNNLFMVKLIKKYQYLKKQYFNNRSDEEIEEELRSLRNYYSHEGYYLESLPIVRNKEIIDFKNVDVQWKVDTKNFVKKMAYLEIYAMAGIQIDEKSFAINAPI